MAPQGETEEQQTEPWAPTGAVISLPDAVARVQQKLDRHRYSPRVKFFLEWWVIDPRTSRWLGGWDIMCVVALLFVALVTPFEIAFLESPLSPEDIVDRFSSVGRLFVVNTRYEHSTNPIRTRNEHEMNTI